jgi:hypothetical protein
VEALLDQIDRASGARLYFVALQAALTVPDICGALGSSDGIATRDRYISWFDGNVASAYRIGTTIFLTGEACYYYRCAVLHQGRASHPRLGYSRVLFLEPKSNGVLMHLNVLNDALSIDVQSFCGDITRAARLWLDQNKSISIVAANLSESIRRHDGGYPPYIEGVPVIA